MLRTNYWIKSEINKKSIIIYQLEFSKENLYPIYKHAKCYEQKKTKSSVSKHYVTQSGKECSHFSNSPFVALSSIKSNFQKKICMLFTNTLNAMNRKKNAVSKQSFTQSYQELGSHFSNSPFVALSSIKSNFQKKICMLFTNTLNAMNRKKNALCQNSYLHKVIKNLVYFWNSPLAVLSSIK